MNKLAKIFLEGYVPIEDIEDSIRKIKGCGVYKSKKKLTKSMNRDEIDPSEITIKEINGMSTEPVVLNGVIDVLYLINEDTYTIYNLGYNYRNWYFNEEGNTGRVVPYLNYTYVGATYYGINTKSASLRILDKLVRRYGGFFMKDADNPYDNNFVFPE